MQKQLRKEPIVRGVVIETRHQYPIFPYS